MATSLFTIGHSNHAIEVFLDLLQTQDIAAVADVRSYPQSKFSPQYDAQNLRHYLQERRIAYLFMGRELGGRPTGEQFYDATGRVLYDRVAEAGFFREGIRHLREEAEQRRIAVMCSEEDPSLCHRRLLITRVLADGGVEVIHIRAHGPAQPEREVLAQEAAEAAREPQLSLFEHSPDPEWKSLQSVLLRRPQDSSSAS